MLNPKFSDSADVKEKTKEDIEDNDFQPLQPTPGTQRT